jgi:putative membrane protein
MKSTVTGALAGALGGLAGTLAMNYAQRLWTLAADDHPPASAAGKHDARDWQERTENQNSNELAAQAIARAVLGRRLRDEELPIAAAAVHFSFGAAVGALYGAYASSPSRRRSGVALGTVLWLTADEIAMPLMGLSDSTTERPAEKHLQSLAAHWVYGFVTEHVQRLSRRYVLDQANQSRDVMPPAGSDPRDQSGDGRSI